MSEIEEEITCQVCGTCFDLTEGRDPVKHGWIWLASWPILCSVCKKLPYSDVFRKALTNHLADFEDYDSNPPPFTLKGDIRSKDIEKLKELGLKAVDEFFDLDPMSRLFGAGKEGFGSWLSAVLMEAYMVGRRSEPPPRAKKPAEELPGPCEHPSYESVVDENGEPRAWCDRCKEFVFE